jgi:hypothetical protein
MQTFCKLAVAVAIALFFISDQPTQAQNNCDPAYPTVCIPPPPPDLDCADIQHRNFRVVGDDPHRFDGDLDGIGCEQR